MKKTLSLVLVTAFIVSLFSSFSLAAFAAMPSPDKLDGYENVCLTYTFNTDRDDYGRHTVDDLKPYVGYYDSDGNLKDFFFDSYLFLPCVRYGPSGALMHAESSKPTNSLDWTTYVSDTFAEGYNLDALEVAFGDAKEQLNAPDKKAGVFLTILYPNKAATNFGNLGGKDLDLSKTEDRKYAIKWIIDEQLKLYNERGYENLDLVGFYWLEEYLKVNEDVELFNYASDYLHSLGLKFIWIPWYCANGYNRWQELGFDVACMQPNLFWMETPAANRVEDSCQISASLGMSMEMELDARALTDKEFFNRYLLYLEDGMKNGAMDSIKMYYQDCVPGIYYQACYSNSTYGRAIYDLTYKYAKSTLTQEDIDQYGDPVQPFEMPENVNWVSKDKPYTASKSYGAGGTAAGYQNLNGKELTDGVLGSSELGTEWHAFHKNYADKDGRMSVTVDLGEVRNDLTHFVAQFEHTMNNGIGYPESLKIHVSEDGENFKLIAAPKLQLDKDYSYILIEKDSPITARYVKLSFENNEHYNFVFCSEFLVGTKGSDSTNVTSEPADTDIVNIPDNDSMLWIITAVVVAVIAVIVIVLVIIKKRTKTKE